MRIAASAGDRKVEYVEFFGAETHVYFKVGSETLVARCDPGSAPRPGQTIPIVFGPDKGHLFDADTGARLSRQAD
jgi:ABC-type sugar transport system ATPase subunit